jgi:hypothetical protein
MATIKNVSSRKISAVLWTVQALLAALFLFGGAMKLVVPIATLEAQSGMSGEFLRFIGLAEFLGGLGLILPGLFGIRTRLTPLAAAGLVIIMIGATALTASAGVGPAIIPLVTGLLALFVAWGRAEVAPHPQRSPHPLVRA